MASLDTTPIRELSDSDLRKRLLVLGFDVPVSVNREFLVKKLENASAGGGKSANKRHSVASSNLASNSSNNQGSSRASPTTVRKRKSIAATPNNNAGSRGQNNVNSTPVSPLASSPAMSIPTTPYSSSPALSIATPTTPSPFVSRLSTPSPPSSPLNNGEPGGIHSPRYMNYYNLFKAGGDGSGGGNNRAAMDDGGYGYAYNRSIRLSAPANFSPVTSVAPPTRPTDRNGYAGGASGTSGVESDWCGGHLVSKILLCGFVLFFIIIGILYVRQSMGVDPRGLTNTIGNSEEGFSTKQAPPPPPPIKKTAPPLPPTSMTFPICGLQGIDPEACIPKEVVKNSRTLFNTLKEELTQRAKWKGCYPNVQDRISLQDAKSILYQLAELRKGDVDSAFQGMLLLVTENPRGGMNLEGSLLEGKLITSKDVANLDATLTNIAVTDVNSYFFCGIVSMLASLTMILVGVGAGIAVCYLIRKGILMRRRKKKSEEDEVFNTVEKVLEMLYQQYELSEKSQGPAYLAVNHIRDELVAPKERQKKDALWNKVVDHISNHESRVREEIQHISGEEFKVWRWLPSASPLTSKRFSTANQKVSRHTMPPSVPYNMNPGPSTSAVPASNFSSQTLYPNLSGLVNEEDDNGVGGDFGDGDNNSNKWQGQAFETCEGSPNALPSTPTTCLKIRHMFTERDGTVNQSRARIEQVILEKCRNSRILHIGIEPASVEGCVYIRCLTKDDARAAFLSLHGWWFDGHLLSVKFLREERYLSRFPEAKHCTVLLGLSH